MGLKKTAKLTGFNGPQFYSTDGSGGGYGLGGESDIDQIANSLWEKGVRYLRLGGTDPIYTAAVSSQHLSARRLKAIGFDIIFGMAKVGAGSTTTPVTWATYQELILTELAICRDNNECDIFSIGNEEEERIGTQTIQSLSRASNVVTATFATPHGFLNGDTVIIAGATPADYNNATGATITSVDDTTHFTYTAAGDDGSASGTLTAKMTNATFIRLVKATAVACRLVAPNIDYIYTSTGTHVAAWVAEGITPDTDLDYYGMNHYSSSSTDTATFRSTIQTAYDGFAQRFFLTEWNLYFVWPTVTTQTNFVQGNSLLQTRFDILEEIGVERAYFYNLTAHNAGGTIVHDFEIIDYRDSTPRNFYYVFFNERRAFHIGGYTSANTIITPTVPIADLRRAVAIDRGKCIDFDQESSYLTFTYPSTFTAANLTSFTIAVRLYCHTLGGSSAGRILSNVNQKFVELFASASGYNAQVWHVTSNGTAATGTNSIKFNEWQTLFVTFSDTENYPRLYLDMIEKTSSVGNKNGARGNANGETGSIGNRSDLVRGYDGLMDDFFIWNKILSTSEMNSYRNGNIPNGYLLGYTMDEASGSVIDQGSSGADGTLTDATQNVTSYLI